MNLFEVLLSSSVIPVLGWALAHSFWQVIILAILLKIALNVLQKGPANTRYLISYITLMLMLILPISTVLWNYSKHRTLVSSQNSVSVTESKEKVIVQPAALVKTNISFSEPFYNLSQEQIERKILPWLVLIWSLGVLIFSLRFVDAWTFTQRLKRDKSHLVIEQLQETLERVSQQLRVSKPLVLLESTLVQVPTVIGWLKPLILIPPSALAGLTPEQLELIIAHEIAHIRRYDYLANLIQTIVEMLLFYHPAVWWVSDEIRRERENACDDSAVSLSSNAQIYASALVKLERLRKTNASLAVAADGGGSLTNRIHRLIGIQMPHSKGYAGLWVIVFISFFMITIWAAKQNSSVIIDPLSSELPSNLISMVPSFNNSELEKDAKQNLSPQIATERQTNKKLPETSAENLLFPNQSGWDTNSKPDEKQHVGFGYNANRNSPESASGQTTETILEAPKDTNQVNAIVNLRRNEVVNRLTNIQTPTESKSESQTESQDFIEEMASVGYSNLSLDELIKLKKAGVNAKYVKSLSALGFNNLTIKDLASMSDENVSPEYIVGIRNAGFQQITGKELAYFKDSGITADFINSFRNAGYDNLTKKDLFTFRDNQITIDYIKSMNSVGFGKFSPNELVSLRESKITPEFLGTARNRLGNNLTMKQIIEFKRNGNLKDNE